MQTKSGMQRTGRGALMMLATLTLLSACARLDASETERAICRELRADLPTWSTKDTPETLDSGARFVSVFDAVCP